MQYEIINPETEDVQTQTDYPNENELIDMIEGKLHDLNIKLKCQQDGTFHRFQ